MLAASKISQRRSRPLDRTEQCCGVCLPACAREASEAAAPKPEGRRRALRPRATARQANLAQGSSASCPVIASGKCAASGRPGRQQAVTRPCHSCQGVAGIAQIPQWPCRPDFPAPTTVRKNYRSPRGSPAQYRVVSFPKRADPLRLASPAAQASPLLDPPHPHP